MPTEPQQPDNRPDSTRAVHEEHPRISSAELLQGQQQLEIDHAGEVYRLRITKTGKLILTK